MLPYLKLIKIDNLFIIAFVQLSIKYGLFEPFGISITLNAFGTALLIIASLSIAAAGNIIIGIYDVEKRLSKYHGVSERIANRLFIIFNVIGVLIGFYLANLIGRPEFAALFVLASGIFYIYASYLKEILVIKNIVIGILAALPLIAVGIFDLLPAINQKNQEFQSVLFSIIMDYSYFAFLIILMREIIKDCLTIDHHHNMGLKTIPIAIGKKRTFTYLGIAALIPISVIVYYVYNYLFSNTRAVIFILLLLVAPLLFFMIRCFYTENIKDMFYNKLILTIVLIFAAISLLSYQLFLK